MSVIRQRYLRTALLGCILFALHGCTTVGRDYKKPEVSVPPKWQQVADPALVPTKAEIKKWWKIFNDPLLNRLIGQASKSNLDLRVAVARVDEARARLGVVSSEMLPSVDTGGGLAHRGTPDNPTLGGGAEKTYYSIGLDASWELDLFGRVKRSVEAATAEFQATEEDRIDVMISMYAEVALNYLNERTLQTRLAVAMANIDSQRQILQLTRSRFKHGLANNLDVAQAESVLANSESLVPPMRIELVRSINTIAVLLGKPPGDLAQELSQPGPIPLPPEKVTVGVPADLLRQRPDIRRAERLLAAQTARIGVAEGDLYPRFTLVGSLNYEATSLGSLFSTSNQAFGFGPAFRWNLFDGGRVRSQIKVEDARTEQALLRYEQTVLNGLNEAENAMTAYLEQRVQFEALTRSAKASKRTLYLATKLYKDGLTGFQDVLDAQRTVFSIEDRVAESRGNAAINMVRLYKALGGGWDPDKKDRKPKKTASQ